MWIIIFQNVLQIYNSNERNHEKKDDVVPKVKEGKLVEICRVLCSLQGVGYGTPSERQRQYQQHRAARAQDAVLDRHLSRIGAEYETAMITRDKKATKKRMVR